MSRKSYARKSFFRDKSVVLSPHNVKLMGPEHTEEMANLMNNTTCSLFGDFNLEELILKRYLALGVYDDNGQLAGVMVLNIYPNIPALPPWEWNHWLYNLYDYKDANSRNTLWIHLLLWEPCYYYFFLAPLIQCLFSSRNFLKYCIMVIPPGKQRTDFFNDLGTVLLPKDLDLEKHKTYQYLYVMYRQSFLKQYKMRRAVEEDNDDLVPLIDTYCPELKDMYGQYYIAEILTKYKETGRQIVVAECEGSAVAVLCLNENVNYEAINEEFELIPYNGLKKPNLEDFKDMSLGKISAEQEQPKTDEEEMEDATITSIPVGELSEVDIISQSESDQYSLVFTTTSIFMFQDDDEKDDKDIRMSLHDSEKSQDILSQYLRRPSRDPRLLEIDTLSLFSSTKGKLAPVPEFHGEPNAFALELAAAYPEHEYGLYNLLEAAFQCFPDRDYCILTLPSTVIPNKLTQYFGRVVPRPTANHPHELYMMHKSCIFGDIDVQVTTKEYINEVNALLWNIPFRLSLIAQVENSIEDKDSIYQSFILLCDNTVIGVATLSQEYEVDYLLAHYEISSITTTHIHKMQDNGVIENVVLSPIFQRHSKYFLRELHRLSQFSMLYYKHFPCDTVDGFRERPLSNVLQNLVHIMPRKQPEYDIPTLTADGYVPPKYVTDVKDPPFALFLSTAPFCSRRRHTINAKIVVVGCSHTALAFLETLLFKQDPNCMVTFNNVSVLCTTGFVYKKILNRIREVFLVKKYFTDTKYMDMLALKTYVNIVQGKVTKIDRREQFIVINKGTCMKYDLLFLMCGEMFQRPLRINREPFVERPENVFIINTAVEANGAVIKLKQIYKRNPDPDYVIIVYGHYLQAFCALNGLLTFGIPGSHLVLVENFPYSRAIDRRLRHNISVFNNPEIDTAIRENIIAQGITVYSSYYFIEWIYDEEDNIITSAKFESRHQMLELKCKAMFFFGDKEIHPRVYNFINNAGLVYDGRLVINSQYQTNDPKIYGAGSLTKYSRKYRTNKTSHKYFSRMEIGHCLGLQIKKMLIPHHMQKYVKATREWNIELERGDTLLPMYTKPIMRYCRLPGGLYYLAITKSGKRVPLETAISHEHYGRVLITGDSRNLNNQGFFRLHINDNRRVETITCLTKFEIDIKNIYCIWGKHEKLLNNICLRFEMVLVTDLFDYFREPWAYAIYHDKFTNLIDDLNMLMTSTVGLGGASIINQVIAKFKDSKWEQITEDAEDELEETFNRLPHKKLIEQKVLDFIRDNIAHLPMYAHPLIIRDILSSLDDGQMLT